MKRAALLRAAHAAIDLPADLILERLWLVIVSVGQCREAAGRDQPDDDEDNEQHERPAGDERRLGWRRRGSGRWWRWRRAHRGCLDNAHGRQAFGSISRSPRGVCPRVPDASDQVRPHECEQVKHDGI